MCVDINTNRARSLTRYSNRDAHSSSPCNRDRESLREDNRVALEVLYGSLSSLHESFELTYSCYERGNVAELLFRCSGNSSKGRVSELQAGSTLSTLGLGLETNSDNSY